MMISHSLAGFAFVYMEDEKDADDAIKRLDRAEFGRKGRRLRVEWTKQDRDSRRSGGGRKPAANDKPSKTFKLMDRVITVEYAIRDDDRSNDRSPDRRGRDFSPERGSYRRRSPSPYRRERGSPDYGYRRDRGSPDYGHGGKSDGRGSPDYGRDESPANGRYHSRAKPDARGSPPDYGRADSPANGRYHSRSKHENRGSPDYDRDEGPTNGGRYHSRSKPEDRGTPDYAKDEGPSVTSTTGEIEILSRELISSQYLAWQFL
ncbi:Serine/arginine-rich splicing factor RS40 [Bienertia sinuspersici]